MRPAPRGFVPFVWAIREEEGLSRNLEGYLGQEVGRAR